MSRNRFLITALLACAAIEPAYAAPYDAAMLAKPAHSAPDVARWNKLA